MRHLLLTVFFFIIISPVFSAGDTIRVGNSCGLLISGFARADYIFDSRQTAEAVEGLFTFYPLNREIDAAGRDINAVPRTNFISVATRLSTRFLAPDIFNAQSSACIEFDFTGTSNTNGVRLRQAYIDLNWKKTGLLLGRTWHPLSSGCIPSVLALNTGAPFWAFNRSDQMRFDYKPDKWLISAVAVYQSDYASLGPLGKSSSYLRDAVLPELSLSWAYRGQQFRSGMAGSVKTIKPRQYTEGNNKMKYYTAEKLTAFSALAFVQYNVSAWVFKAQGMYAQNMTESLMLGGYAIREYDLQTGHEKYTQTAHACYWINIDCGKTWQTGVFAGYLNSLGTLHNVLNLAEHGAWFARAPDIKSMYRISPHIIYNRNNMQIAGELECTTAIYGNIKYGNRARITATREVTNIRTNLAVCFYF